MGLYAYMLICLYAYMLICLYAYVETNQTNFIVSKSQKNMSKNQIVITGKIIIAKEISISKLFEIYLK